MSVKKRTSTMYVTRNGIPTCMEDGVILVTDRAEALVLSTERLVQGTMLFVIRSGGLYMLDTDGGNWYNTSTGALLSEERE
jgi:hypothetical protein